MSDVNTFVDAIGADVNTAVAPRVKGFTDQFREKTFAEYGPRISAFASDLVKDIIDEQAAAAGDLVTVLIRDLFQRYRPQLAGDLRANFLNGCIELTGNGIRLDLTRRDTGAPVASLDLPVSLRINVDDLAVTLQNTSIKLDVVR
jgi:hypothetical protein